MTRAKNKRKAGILLKTVLALNLFFILLLILSYITPYVKVERWGWLTLLALTYPFVMMLNGCFAVAWLLNKRWYAIFSIITILAGMGVHGRYFKLFSLPAKTACPETIRVLSYNLRGMSMVPVEKGASAERRIESLYTALNEAKEFPDIFCIQEGSKGDYIGDQFGLKNVIHGSKSTLWILSRFPIVHQGELMGEENNPFCIWADIKTDQGMLRVYNMHLMSNRVTNTTEELIQDMDFQKENTWNSIRFIMSRYRFTTKLRSKEAALLHNHIQSCTYPALITGDANDTPISHTYRVLAEGLKDSFRERGSGFSTTYDSTLPLLRIDYLLGTSQIQFKDHITHHLSYSDHYPISSGICIKKEPGS